MHILHIDLGREMRGGQRQVLMLMEGLRDIGHSSELLARRRGPLYRAAQALHFPVAPASLKSLMARSRRADLVHAHDARSHSFAAIASRQSFVVSRRVAFLPKDDWFSNWKYRRAQRFLAVSEFVAGELKRAGVPAERIDVVYDGVQADVNPAHETGSGASIVALASRDPLKGRDLAENAAAIANVPLVFSEDLAGDLQHASMFLYITRSEGFGSAALLAMSFELPVIASRTGGLPEIVVDGDSGLLVENHPSAIAEAILRLVKDPKFARALGRNARARVEQRFTAKHLVAGTLNSYRRALAG